MKHTEIVRYKQGEFQRVQDTIAEEAILKLEIGDGIAFTTMVTPEDIEPFVYGNLYSEGFIQQKEDLENFQTSHRGDMINVTMDFKGPIEKTLVLKRNYNIVWTECGSQPELRRVGDVLVPMNSNLHLDPKGLLTIQKKTKEFMDHFRLTGGVHYAYLFDREMELLEWAYDIGRHNAVDKVMGKHLLAGGTFGELVLYTTGRISIDLVLKCVRARTPVVVSKGAPLFGSLAIAEKFGVCIIGFLRGKRFNIYTNEALIDLGPGIGSRESGADDGLDV